MYFSDRKLKPFFLPLENIFGQSCGLGTFTFIVSSNIVQTGEKKKKIVFVVLIIDFKMQESQTLEKLQRQLAKLFLMSSL